MAQRHSTRKFGDLTALAVGDAGAVEPDDDWLDSHGLVRRTDNTNLALHDGSVPSDDPEAMGIPAVMVVAGRDLAPQLNNGYLVAADATRSELMRSRHYPVLDDKRSSFTRLMIDPESKELEVSLPRLRGVQAMLVHDDRPVYSRAGVENLLCELTDTSGQSWIASVETGQGRRSSMAKALAHVAEQGGLKILKPDLFNRNAPSMDGFVAVDPQSITSIALKTPDRQRGHWVLTLDEAGRDNISVDFGDRQAALDAMAHCLETLGRDIDYASVERFDMATNKSSLSMVSRSELKAPGDDGASSAQAVEVKAMLCDPPKAPDASIASKEAGGVALNPEWRGKRNAHHTDLVQGVVALAARHSPVSTPGPVLRPAMPKVQ